VSSKADIVELLLGKGADVNQPTTDDGTKALSLSRFIGRTSGGGGAGGA